MLEALKKDVFEANLELVKKGLVIYTWGNVSGISPDRKYFVIKPSGVDYDIMKWEDMVVCDMDGNVVEGTLRPSSDMPTHLEIYKAFPEVGGVVHTHSPKATAWAQAGRGIPAYGTTHADYFRDEIPCTDFLKETDMADYEKNTGVIICETFKALKKDPSAVPGVLVGGHGPFTWGKDAANAVYNAVVLEAVASMALDTESINPVVTPLPSYISDKHYFRKHGANAYYGQK
ncbi:MAG: L-ribulose-5-phosphate 4-epimerase [Parasporobacterium sp.]|nr:L-ribulose-5-phosphate 4-epimerase [Parasporobacterium sp.]